MIKSNYLIFVAFLLIFLNQLGIASPHSCSCHEDFFSHPANESYGWLNKEGYSFFSKSFFPCCCFKRSGGKWKILEAEKKVERRDYRFCCDCLCQLQHYELPSKNDFWEWRTKFCCFLSGACGQKSAEKNPNYKGESQEDTAFSFYACGICDFGCICPKPDFCCNIPNCPMPTCLNSYCNAQENCCSKCETCTHTFCDGLSKCCSCFYGCLNICCQILDQVEPGAFDLSGIEDFVGE